MTTTSRLRLDEARAAVRENAPKVLNETVYKERIALTEEESRASAIEEAIERAAVLLVDDYDPAGVLPLENAARARLRIVLDDMLGIRAEHVERIKQERVRRDEEAAEKKRMALALSNPEAALRAECERIARVYAKRAIRDGAFPALDDELGEELRIFILRSIDLHHLIVTFPGAKSTPFPTDALGPTLAGVTNAIIEIAQCQPSLAALTVLGHVAGAAQAIADVRTPEGVLLTSGASMPIVKSSDGKGIAWKIVIAPFLEYEKELAKAHIEHVRRFQVGMVIWSEEYDRMKKSPDFPDLTAKVEAITNHEKLKPRRPNDPYIVFTGGGTAEGIIKHMAMRPPSCIHSVTDAAQFLRGSGFGEQNSAATGSQLIDLVNSGRAERTIKGERGEQNIRIEGRRLSQCLMIQPDVVLRYTGNTELRRLGLHARYLKTAEASIADQRIVDSLNAIDVSEDQRIAAYSKTVLAMLRGARFKPGEDGLAPHVLDADAVEPLELRLSREATILSDAFRNEIAPLTTVGKQYGGEAREEARKVGEHAIRMAGRLHVFDAFVRSGSAPKVERLPPVRLKFRKAGQNGPVEEETVGGESDAPRVSEVPMVEVIQPDTMRRAIKIVRWFLDEARRYILSMTQTPESEHEKLVIDWIRRAVEDTGLRWKPADAVPDGWIITKDDWKRGPNEMRLNAKGQTEERTRVWTSMFEAMSTAEPPRAYLIGDPTRRGLKVRIPRRAVYP